MTYGKDSKEWKNQVILLLLLGKLKEFGFQTQRLKLQKLVYLLDIFGTILHKKPTSYTFKAYKYGPYSKAIFTDVERLVCLDAVKVKEIGSGWDDPNEDRSFEYEIHKSRLSKIDLISSTNEYYPIEKSVELAVQAAGRLSGEEIRKLVYNEPNYIEAKRKGFGTTIDPEYSFAARFGKISRSISRKEFGVELVDEEVLWLYVNFLHEIPLSRPTTNGGL